MHQVKNHSIICVHWVETNFAYYVANAELDWYGSLEVQVVMLSKSLHGIIGPLLILLVRIAALLIVLVGIAARDCL